MDNYQDIISSMLAQSLKKQYRMSDRQITLLEWSQVIGGTIKMRGTGREVNLTPEQIRALKTLPVRGRFVFSTSPYPPKGAPSESLPEKFRRRLPTLPKFRIQIVKEN